MRKFVSQPRRWCVAAVAASFASVAVTLVAFAVDGDSHLTRRSLNFGLIRSMSIPVVWQVGSAKGSTSSLLFLKDAKDLWDCDQSVEVCAPEHVQADLLLRLTALTKLSHSLSSTELDSIKELPYFGQVVNGQSDSSTGTIYSIGDRSAVLVERRGNTNGACQPLKGGGSRRPLISYVSGVVYIPGAAETIQAIKFRSEVMGDTETCEAVIRTVLKSIEWQDQ